MENKTYEDALNRVNQIYETILNEVKVMLKFNNNVKLGNHIYTYDQDKVLTDNMSMYIDLDELCDLHTYLCNFDTNSIIQMLLDLDCTKITQFMHHIGKWDYDDDYVTEYSKNALSQMINDALDMGYCVTMELNVGHDYYICRKKTKFDAFTITAHIIGLSDEKEEWEDFLDTETLAKEIQKNREWYDFLVKLSNK